MRKGIVSVDSDLLQGAARPGLPVLAIAPRQGCVQLREVLLVFYYYYYYYYYHIMLQYTSFYYVMLCYVIVYTVLGAQPPQALAAVPDLRSAQVRAYADRA